AVSFVAATVHRDISSSGPHGCVACAGARRDEPSANSPQLASTASGAAPNGIVYEPVRSYRKPAAAGPSAAPQRQPRLSTPRIAPSARVPNTSGTALASIVSAAAKPIPSATS